MIAVSTGHLEIVRMLLQTNKVDIEQSNSSGVRSLHYACSKKFYEVKTRKDGIDTENFIFIFRLLNYYLNMMLMLMQQINMSKRHWIVVVQKEIQKS